MESSVQKRVHRTKMTARPFRKRTCILVLGMHRSGTSALCRVLNLLGCDLPKTLMPPNAANEPGYWESMAIYKLNDRILESAGSAWHDWLELNPRWFDSPKADEFREVATASLTEEFGSSRLFVLKDPRICRLFPFWKDVLAQSGVTPLVWLPMRNPLEVAASLEKRDNFEPALGLLLWLRSVLDAEFASRGSQRIFSTYDQLMLGWGRLAKKAEATLGISWPRFSDRAAGEIDAFLSGRHRHHQTYPEDVLENPNLATWVREVFAIMTRWAELGEDAKDRPVLDRMRSEFNAAAPAFARLIADGRTARAKAASLEQALAASANKIEAAQVEQTAKDQKTRQLEQELASVRDRIVEREKTVAELRAELEKRAAAMAQERERAGKFEAELSTLRTRATAAEGGVAEREKIVAELRAELERRAAALAQEHERAGKLETEIAALTARATTAEQNVTALRDEVGRRRQEVERIEEGKASAERHVARLREQLEAQIAAVAEAEKLFVEVRDRLSETQSALTQRSLEAEQTAAELANTRSKLEEGAAWRVEAEKVAESQYEQIQSLKADIHAREAAFEALVTSSSDLRQQLDAAVRQLSETDARFAEIETEARSRDTEHARELSALRDETKAIAAVRDEGDKAIAGLKEHIVFLMADIERLKAESASQTDERRRIERTKDDELDRLRAELGRLKSEADAMNKRAVEAERLKTEIGKAKAELDTELARTRSENDRLRLEQADANRSAQEEQLRFKQRLDERFNEIATLSRLLKATESRLYAKDEAIEMSRIALAQDMKRRIEGVFRGRLWQIVPARVRAVRQMALLKRTGLFDPDWYLETYKDVANASADPLRHYVLHGFREGREPNRMLATLRSAG